MVLLKLVTITASGIFDAGFSNTSGLTTKDMIYKVKKTKSLIIKGGEKIHKIINKFYFITFRVIVKSKIK